MARQLWSVCKPGEAIAWSLRPELLTRAQQEGMRIKEVPVSHFPRSAGKQTGANLKVIIKAFRELFEMRARLRVR